jgi:hypothetical protein
MKKMTVLPAGCLFGGLIALALVATASAQAVYAPPVVPAPAYANSLVYPYGHPCLPHHAYRKAVRFGFIPVAPPATLCHGPTCYFGCPFYGPPYYAYPRPQVACPGYAGFSGTNPNAYRTMVPPPIRTTFDPRAAVPTPMPAEQLPTPPAQVTPAAETIPTPPSFPAPK